MNEMQKASNIKKHEWTALMREGTVLCIIAMFFGGWYIGSFSRQPATAPKFNPKLGVVVLYLQEADGIRIKVTPEDPEVVKELQQYLDNFPRAEVKGHSINP